MSRRVFISDIHLSAGLSFLPGYAKHPYDWFTQNDRRRLIGFLTWLSEQCDPAGGNAEPRVDEVVLLGDIFDNWVFPHDQKPPAMAEIVGSDYAKPVVSALRELSEKTGVLFLPGNHDLTLDKATLHSALPKVIHGGPGQVSPYFVSGRLRAEHGNAHALFCSVDPNRPDGLPMAYFISRLGASAVRDTGDDVPNLTTLMEELIDVCGAEKLPESVLDAACDRLGAGPTTKVQMPDDLWGGCTVEIGEVRALYANVLEEWQERYGKLRSLMAISAELGVLEPIAHSLFRRRATTAVIFGHTHTVRARHYVRFGVGAVAYCNTGCWCKEQPEATWVDVYRPKGSKKSRVSLFRWEADPISGSGVPARDGEPLIVD